MQEFFLFCSYYQALNTKEGNRVAWGCVVSTDNFQKQITQVLLFIQKCLFLPKKLY